MQHGLSIQLNKSAVATFFSSHGSSLLSDTAQTFSRGPISYLTTSFRKLPSSYDIKKIECAIEFIFSSAKLCSILAPLLLIRPKDSQ